MVLPQPAASAGPGQVCWCLDVRVVVVLVTLAGALLLLLLYRLLVLRHRLARCRPDLRYHSFYHSARYTLKDPGLPYTLPDTGDIKNTELPRTLPGTGTTLKDPGLPLALPVTGLEDPPVTGLPPTLPASGPAPEVSPEEPPPPKLPLPSAHLHPPLLPLPPLPLTLPPPFTPPPGLTPPLPIIHTTPPSPPLSWGACSDMEVYSRIGAFRPSRASSLRHIQVILFEHSSL